MLFIAKRVQLDLPPALLLPLLYCTCFIYIYFKHIVYNNNTSSSSSIFVHALNIYFTTCAACARASAGRLASGRQQQAESQPRQAAASRH